MYLYSSYIQSYGVHGCSIVRPVQNTKCYDTNGPHVPHGEAFIQAQNVLEI